MKAAMGFLTMMKLVTAGITAAFSEAQKLTPGAVSTALAGANAGAKATTGIDFARSYRRRGGPCGNEARLRGAAAVRWIESRSRGHKPRPAAKARAS
jgi:hypothetical protein